MVEIHSHPEPLNLIVLWPRRYQPTERELLALLERATGTSVQVQHRPEPEPPVKWMAIIDPPHKSPHKSTHNSPDKSSQSPLIVWCEPMRPLPQATLDHVGAQHAKWVIGFETHLDLDDALEDEIRLFRTIGKAMPDSPAILNVNTELWHLQHEVAAIARGDEVVDEPFLFAVHAIGNPPVQPDADSRVCVYTVGLACCGLPELEMLDVPMEHARSATVFLTGVAALVLERGLPLPGRAMEIGPDLFIALQPWREVAQHLDEHAAGSLNKRELHNGAHASGNRLAVCGSEPIGSFRKIWSWPAAAFQAVCAGDKPLYVTHRATQRTAQRAQRTWNAFINAFQKASQPDSSADAASGAFFIQAGVSEDGAQVGVGDGNEEAESELNNEPASPGAAGRSEDVAGREHLWFQAVSFDGSRVEGILQTQPAYVKSLQPGDRIWIERATVSNWIVQQAGKVFGPAEAAAESVGRNEIRT